MYLKITFNKKDSEDNVDWIYIELETMANVIV